MNPIEADDWAPPLPIAAYPRGACILLQHPAGVVVTRPETTPDGHPYPFIQVTTATRGPIHAMTLCGTLDPVNEAPWGDDDRLFATRLHDLTGSARIHFAEPKRMLRQLRLAHDQDPPATIFLLRGHIRRYEPPGAAAELVLDADALVSVPAAAGQRWMQAVRDDHRRASEEHATP